MITIDIKTNIYHENCNTNLIDLLPTNSLDFDLTAILFLVKFLLNFYF